MTIAPSFADNQPPVTDCEQNPCAAVPPQPSNFLYLRTAPSEDAPLIADPLLTPSGPGTTAANDWGDKAVTGQTFAVADRQGDWTAIYYGGQEAWVHASEGNGLAPGRGTLVTPKPGADSIPVYGRSYPGNMAADRLGYTIPAGQAYVSSGVVGADYYHATTYNQPGSYLVFADDTAYYAISFNHRRAFLKASDVVEVTDAPPAAPVTSPATPAAPGKPAAPRPRGCTIRGTRGDDVLTGMSKRDVICGLSGDDVLLRPVRRRRAAGRRREGPPRGRGRR